MASAVTAHFHAANLSAETTRTFDAAPMSACVQQKPGRWLWRADVENLEAGEILVPSLTIADGEPYGFRFALETTRGCVALPGFGDFSGDTKALASQHLSTHIDYFGALDDLEGASLVLEVQSETPPHERPILVGISQRAERLNAPTPGSLTTSLIDVPALCQREAPADIAMRICSPTCVTMVLRKLGVGAELLDLSRRAYDAASGLYGVWPQNLYAASRDHVIGAVRTFDSLEQAAELITRGLAVVASLRYAQGELEGAAMDATGGHLMVICGFAGERVIVNDPVMPGTDEVRRSYDLGEFGRIWLRERGAGYVMAPV